jgi:hypothetical protein
VLTHATIPEIANAEKINESNVGRVLRLTLLEDIERSIVHLHLVGVAGESLRLKA